MVMFPSFIARASLHAPCSRSYIASTIDTPQPITSQSRSAPPFHHVARYFPVSTTGGAYRKIAISRLYVT